MDQYLIRVGGGGENTPGLFRLRKPEISARLMDS